MVKKSLRISLIAVLTGLGVAFRVSKNAITQIQFINIPLAFTMVGGYLGGPLVGGTVGLFTFIISDFVILPGPWTVVDSLLASVIGVLWGSIRRFVSGRLQIFIAAFFSELLYDIVSSVILYIVIGMDVMKALAIGIVGLFLPVCGGFIFGIGPMTEISTALLSSLVISHLEKVGVRAYGK